MKLIYSVFRKVLILRLWKGEKVQIGLLGKYPEQEWDQFDLRQLRIPQEVYSQDIAEIPFMQALKRANYQELIHHQKCPFMIGW